ncbi:MAG: hypothetical protein BWX49_00466 [Bacteroidetes bacterium ADurb.Bin008]|nr:MAG: hypothetical protein BWX49_00466 [Bacteroidetes bacterium ADurb.Bin008]
MKGYNKFSTLFKNNPYLYQTIVLTKYNIHN